MLGTCEMKHLRDEMKHLRDIYDDALNLILSLPHRTGALNFADTVTLQSLEIDAANGDTQLLCRNAKKFLDTMSHYTLGSNLESKMYILYEQTCKCDNLVLFRMAHC